MLVLFFRISLRFVQYHGRLKVLRRNTNLFSKEMVQYQNLY
jgi:hypothetical protein